MKVSRLVGHGRLVLVVAVGIASSGCGQPSSHPLAQATATAAPTAAGACPSSPPSSLASGTVVAFVARRGTVLPYVVDSATGCLVTNGAGVDVANPVGMATTPDGHYLYVVDEHREDHASSRILKFVIDPVAGRLAPAGGVPFEAGGSQALGAIRATNGDVFVYANAAITGYSGGSWFYRIDPHSGDLWFRGSLPVDNDLGISSMALAPSGLLYALAYVDGDWAIQSLEASPFDDLTDRGDVANAGGCVSAVSAVDPNGQYLWMGCAVYELPYTGIPRLLSVADPQDESAALAVDPRGRFIYRLANREGATYLEAREIDRSRPGAWPLRSSLPRPDLGRDDSLHPEPGGRFLYVVNYARTELAAYRIGTSGGLERLETTAPGSDVAFVTVP